jgi:hypothetical protein
MYASVFLKSTNFSLFLNYCTVVRINIRVEVGFIEREPEARSQYLSGSGF